MKFKLTATAAAGILAATVAYAEYPEKPVSFIVPWPPGDLEDVLTRMIAEDFQSEYGVAAAVVNSPAGAEARSQAPSKLPRPRADGYTIGSFVVGVPVLGHQHRHSGIDA